jgi:uncharacterized protein YjbI with pentapeptide repeats
MKSQNWLAKNWNRSDLKQYTNRFVQLLILVLLVGIVFYVTYQTNLRQEQAVLVGYFDQITALLVTGDQSASTTTDIQNLARARTVATLHQLNGRNKGQLLQFLAEANLIVRNQPQIGLEEVDLRGVELVAANLPNISLERANLSKFTGSKSATGNPL